MKISLLAAIMTVSLASIGTGCAKKESDLAAAQYAFPNFWGESQAQCVPMAIARRPADGPSVSTYVTQSIHGTWLFPPSPYR
jgi:hypothetical protein